MALTARPPDQGRPTDTDAVQAERNTWHVQEPDTVVAALNSDRHSGLTAGEAGARRRRYGLNEIASEPGPSMWAIALRQLEDPMNLMLVAVAVVSIVIGEVPTAIVVVVLVGLNIVLGTQQELKARASVDALARMQTPQTRVIRDGILVQLAATDLVPGDIVQVEAGDIVPADGRLLTTATLETQEAALTGESTPVPKDPHTLDTADVALGDRSNMVFQNTSVTRGTATMIVTETGMHTEMGRIASMLSAVAPSKSPLQRELDSLTKILGIIAWAAVAIIVIIGLVRGQELATLLLLGISMGVSAIPTGLPTFVQAMLAFGARQLADAKAVVKNLTDVETLGATSAINSDKTGTLTMNQMTVRSLYFHGRWYTVDGEGYDKTGRIAQAAGLEVPDFTLLAYGLCLDSDATVSDTGDIVGDPTEAALVVLAAKIGIDAPLTRRTYPRVAEVPFDSAYKFMATFHHLPVDGTTRFVELVKGGPDVVLARCTSAYQPGRREVPIEEVRDDLAAANRTLSEQGLRVLAFAVRLLDGREEAVQADPMSFVGELIFVGMVGIIDPLRPEAVDSVRTARAAGIEVRMITGDHAITASAIGAELGLGPGAIGGAELHAMSDEELTAALPNLHVFGRVTPQDKLRLADLMQRSGAVVAMTGDAVNDAAALKKADIGVAMGSGSEVTKQAGKMVLTDDNFGTLITAIRLGRSIYDKIVSYIRYQMSKLFSLVLLFLVASIFDINDGVALTPLMVLFQHFFITLFPVAVIMLDPPPPNLMTKTPRDPGVPIANRTALLQWLAYGILQFAVTLAAMLLAPGELSPTAANVPMTTAFVVLSFGSILSGLALRRDPDSGMTAPVLRALGILSIPVVVTVFAVEAGFLQDLLMTTSLTGGQWLACVGWSLLVPVVIEGEKVLRRRRRSAPTAPIPVAAAVAPQRVHHR
ncbi:cation-transporting P-type ATPase [Rhodococcus ruber]|uniref:ATPase, P-type (Transporting), HAD superfamily, subfamily IC family protein n=1 Tax=Rhodococcus ruber TaxID=1830 RepID=A0A098BJ08_9NOCA|nr:cation-transporting P-type ATPase [Rhodococcus ruber]MCD2129794.1 cation-transporting P-type ATPase [Rhodococcus ruber]MCZ4506232.1 cation-transporting P-type ATPase [Rhodococcus ruber]MCZ4533331.1 cation-transporting P-type ATPase [Rhodococcus ruber]MCZ4623767.1 cation-transporting P-type ATPase [Rhodococcus ruber]MDI9971117.1 cation-transporting P-type ATPase [Rhodococcus ruber]